MNPEAWTIAGAVILMVAILVLAYIDPFTQPRPPDIDTAAPIPGPDMAQLDDEDLV